MVTADRILILSSRLSNRREIALRSVFQLDGRLDLRAPGLLPDLTRYQAVVLDGPQEVPDLDRLHAFVSTGGALLAIGAAPGAPDASLARLLGVSAGEPLPEAEVWGSVSRDHDLTHRVDAQFLLVDSLRPLQPLKDDVRPLVTVQWAFQEQTVTIERRIDQGRVVVTTLGNGAEALQTPALATMLRRAARREPGAQRTLGVGIVGYGAQGGMGFLHGTAVANVSGLDLLAVCDRVSTRLDAARAEFPGVRVYKNPDDIAGDPGIDIAIIATPPVAHSAIALELMEAGKHVVCEKPLCLTLKEADMLIEAAERNGVVLTVNHNRRWDADYLAIVRLIQEGRLGQVFNVETFAGDFAHPCRFWHSDESVSGGAVYDWGAHHIDWILQLLPGMPASVTANDHKRVWHDVTNADQVRVRLAWRDGREAEFVYSDIAAVRRPKFYIQGTQATLVGHYRPVAFERLDPAEGYVREEAHYAEAPAHLILGRYESGYGIAQTTLPLPSPPRFPLLRNLADHLLLGEPLAVTAASARRVVAVLEAATRSAQQRGSPVALSPAL